MELFCKPYYWDQIQRLKTTWWYLLRKWGLTKQIRLWCLTQLEIVQRCYPNREKLLLIESSTPRCKAIANIYLIEWYHWNWPNSNRSEDGDRLEDSSPNQWIENLLVLRMDLREYLLQRRDAVQGEKHPVFKQGVSWLSPRSTLGLYLIYSEKLKWGVCERRFRQKWWDC